MHAHNTQTRGIKSTLFRPFFAQTLPLSTAFTRTVNNVYNWVYNSVGFQSDSSLVWLSRCPKIIINYEKCEKISVCVTEGQYSTFSNSGSNSQFWNCDQSGLDYSSYSGFSHSTGYSPYYTSPYGSYIPNSSSSNVNSGSPPSGLSSSPNSSTATYQLTQLPQQSGLELFLFARPTDKTFGHYRHQSSSRPIALLI